MGETKELAKKKKFKMPHTLVIIFIIILAAVLFTWIVPSGEYVQIEDPVTGRELIDPDSFHFAENTPVNPLRIMNYIIDGFMDAADLIFMLIIQGAALIAGVIYDMKEGDRLTNKIPVLSLNQLIMENAELVHAPRISLPREKTGSSDFSNVMYQLPGSCIRVAMVPPGTSSHSAEFLNAGKGEEAHEAVLIAAKVLSGTACDLIEDPARLDGIQAEFRENQEKHS